MYSGSMKLNNENVVKAIIETGPHNRILDIGCWDGEFTLQVKNKLPSPGIMYGIEPVKFACDKASHNGIKCEMIKADDPKVKWPYEDDFFDCIYSNQVIEHLSNVDFFLSEASRCLKQGGTLVTSTNNLSSLHNIFAIIMGWAPFDLTNSSTKMWSIGNPLSIHSGEQLGENQSTWTHKCVYNIKWLKEWMGLCNLKFISARGSGFHPFPPILGKYIPKYSAFITITCKKIKAL